MPRVFKIGGYWDSNSRINERVLSNILRIIEARSFEVVEKWTAFFGEAHYYC